MRPYNSATKEYREYFADKICKIREGLFTGALEELKKERKIIGYIKTAKYSCADMDDIDYYVVVNNGFRYLPVTFSIGGPKERERSKKKRNQEAIYVGIKINDSMTAIKERVLNSLEEVKRKSRNGADGNGGQKT